MLLFLRVYLHQRDGSLHQFADALDTHSEGNSDFPVAHTLGAKQETLPLLRSEVHESGLEAHQSFCQEDHLLRVRRRIDPLLKDGLRIVFTITKPATFGPVQIHGEVVGDAKHPGSKVVVRARVSSVSNQAEEGLLNNIFRVILAQAARVKVATQGGPDFTIKLDDSFAILRWFPARSGSSTVRESHADRGCAKVIKGLMETLRSNNEPEEAFQLSFRWSCRVFLLYLRQSRKSNRIAVRLPLKDGESIELRQRSEATRIDQRRPSTIRIGGFGLAQDYNDRRSGGT